MSNINDRTLAAALVENVIQTTGRVPRTLQERASDAVLLLVLLFGGVLTLLGLLAFLLRVCE